MSKKISCFSCPVQIGALFSSKFQKTETIERYFLLQDLQSGSKLMSEFLFIGHGDPDNNLESHFRFTIKGWRRIPRPSSPTDCEEEEEEEECLRRKVLHSVLGFYSNIICPEGLEITMETFKPI
jgi:hypothetical protein